MPDNRILLQNEWWTVKTFGPRYYSATRKDGEHRLYFSLEALSRDFPQAGEAALAQQGPQK